MSQSVALMQDQLTVIVQWDASQPLDRLFRQIEIYTTALYRRANVIYDFSACNLSPQSWSRFLEAQSSGRRGSITDPAIRTMLVGEQPLLPHLTKQFEQPRYGGIRIDAVKTMEQALSGLDERGQIISAM